MEMFYKSMASFLSSFQGSFHAHAMDFFPDGTENFYEDLVWTFQQVKKSEHQLTYFEDLHCLPSMQISGGEDLPCDGKCCLIQWHTYTQTATHTLLGDRYLHLVTLRKGIAQ